MAEEVSVGEKMEITTAFRYAVGGIRVIDIPKGQYVVGTGEGELHPDAANNALNEGRGKKAAKGGQKSGAQKSGGGEAE